MAELTQSEADALLAMDKYRVDEKIWNYPGLGGREIIPLTSSNGREKFLLDIRRGRVSLRKGTYQTRGRQTAILARLDFGGSPHRNPDGEEIESPHLHVYREGFADKWAIPIPKDSFPNTSDLWQLLEDFIGYCNIVHPPIFNRGVFK